MNSLLKLLLAFIIILSSCSKTIETADLYGKWDYKSIKNANPEDIMSDDEVQKQNASITFNNNNDLVIEWGGKRLSYGKFKLDGKMIRYTEFLEGGSKREFPFLIIKLTENELTFQTMEKDFTKVIAIKNANK